MMTNGPAMFSLSSPPFSRSICSSPAAKVVEEGRVPLQRHFFHFPDFKHRRHCLDPPSCVSVVAFRNPVVDRWYKKGGGGEDGWQKWNSLLVACAVCLF